MVYLDQYQLEQVMLVIELDQVQMVKQMFEVVLVELILVDHLNNNKTNENLKTKRKGYLPLSTIIAPCVPSNCCASSVDNKTVCSTPFSSIIFAVIVPICCV